MYNTILGVYYYIKIIIVIIKIHQFWVMTTFEKWKNSSIKCKNPTFNIIFHLATKICVSVEPLKF